MQQEQVSKSLPPSLLRSRESALWYVLGNILHHESNIVISKTYIAGNVTACHGCQPLATSAQFKTEMI